MPEHKSQHYVPRCHLKPFALDGSGRSICVFNIDKEVAIQNAPIKGQCAKTYFYGKDLELEKLLQPIEGGYADVVRRIEHDEKSVTEQSLQTLRRFMLLQYGRTDFAMQRMKISYQKMHHAAHLGMPVEPEEIDTSDHAMLLTSLRMHLRSMKYIVDLKMCIVKNNTHERFITSDDPCIFTNRFHIQKLHRNSFGLGSSGAIIILPLTPQYTFLLYDGDIYTIPEKKNNTVSTNNISDIRVINELQHLKSAHNLYFSNWEDRDRIAAQFRASATRRLKSWHRISVFVRDSVTSRGEHFRRASQDELTSSRNRLLQMASHYPVPTGWFSKLKFRTPPKYFFDGSAAGHIRIPIARLRKMERDD